MALHVTGRRPARARVREAGVGYLFVAPIVIFFAIFVGYPFVRSLYLSLSDWSGIGEPRFVGFGNFGFMLRDPVFWQALTTTVVFTAVTTVLQTVVPLLLAVLMNGPWRGSVIYRTLLFMPAVISLVVTGALWQLIYEPNLGTLNEALRALGLGTLAQPWLADPDLVVPALIVVSLWQAAGLYMLIYLAGLQGIDPTLYEAARIDGAGPFQRFRRVTVPALRMVTGVVVLLNLINGLKTFDLIYVMTGGGPNRASEVLGTYLYGLAFGNESGATPSFGYATAISMVIFVLCMLVTIAQLRISRRTA
ncbi:carbohydrate ABC transporter permease [Nonomuraea sp. M3C6]|uniref:Carbohydrate ABC transporter permease n=1 Tax=Nonomuraea marmarensis TaxID=3351344 RepID=A0ABW7ARG1_9ACTN